MFKKDDINRLSLLLCGFALQAAWLFLAYYGPLQMDPATTLMLLSSPLSFISGNIVAVVVLLCGIMYRQVEKLVDRSWFLALCGALFAAGSLAGSAFEADTAGNLIANTVARAGSALMLVGWLRVFANFDTDTILKTTPSIIALSALLCVLLMPLMEAARPALLATLAAVSTTWLLKAHRAAFVALPPSNAATPRALAIVCGAAFLMSLLLGVLCGLAASPSTFYLYFLLMLGVILIALATMALARERREATRGARAGNSVYMWLPGVFGAGALLAGVVLQPDAGAVINALGRCCLEIALIVAFIIAARHYRCSLVQAYSFGQAAFLIGNLMGMLLATEMLSSGLVETAHLSNLEVIILLLACEAAAVFAFLYVLANRDHSRMIEAFATPDTPAESGAPEPDGVDHVIDTYRLSKKESEVLRLFAKGRSRQRIAEEMLVSLGSVNSYLYRIYQKTGVHSRQELLDVLEGKRRDE